MEHMHLDSSVHQAIGKRNCVPLSTTNDASNRWLQLLYDLELSRKNKISEDLGVDQASQSLVLPIHHNVFHSLPSYSSDFKRNTILRMANEGITMKENNRMGVKECLKFSESLISFVQDAAKGIGDTERCLPEQPQYSQAKVPLEKCQRCSLEFCSTINYRRHTTIHRRSFRVDKDSKESLGSFWDKLSVNEQMDFLSYKNVEVEGVSDSLITNLLFLMISRWGFASLPEIYVKAGSTLLDLAQANPSRFPISSRKLFCIFDDASETTFLCAGTSVSSQSVFMDGEIDTVGLEARNVIACFALLIEERLVKAWLVDKDAEALKNQELLMEEEAAKNIRQTKILEQKSMKKLRQKEKKAKEHDSEKKSKMKEHDSEKKVKAKDHGSASGSNLKKDGTDVVEDIFSSLDSKALLDLEPPSEVPTLSLSTSMKSRLTDNMEKKGPKKSRKKKQEAKERRSATRANQKDTSNVEAETSISREMSYETVPLNKCENTPDVAAVTLLNAEMSNETSSPNPVVTKGPSEDSADTSLMDSEAVQTKKVKSEQVSSSAEKLDKETSQRSEQTRGFTFVGVEENSSTPTNVEDRVEVEEFPEPEQNSTLCDVDEDSNKVYRPNDVSRQRGFSETVEMAKVLFAQRWKDALESDHVMITSSPTDESNGQLEDNDSN